MKKVGLYVSALATIGMLAVIPNVMAATGTMTATGAIAPNIQLNVTQDLNFGELLIQTYGAPGYNDIDETTGTPTLSNAGQVGAPLRGIFTIRGRAATNVSLTVVPGAYVCDGTYLSPCVGTPVLTIRNTFTSTGVGQISAASCTGIVCTDTVYVGGRFAFAGTEEGRWTNSLAITANYQ